MIQALWRSGRLPPSRESLALNVLHSARLRTWNPACTGIACESKPRPGARFCTVQDSGGGTRCATPLGAVTKRSHPRGLAQCKTPGWNTVCHAARRRYETKPTPGRSLAQCKTPEVGHGVPRRSRRRYESHSPARSCTVQDSGVEHGVPPGSPRRNEPTPRAVLHCARLRTWNTVCRGRRRGYPERDQLAPEGRQPIARAQAPGNEHRSHLKNSKPRRGDRNLRSRTVSVAPPGLIGATRAPSVSQGLAPLAIDRRPSGAGRTFPDSLVRNKAEPHGGLHSARLRTWNTVFRGRPRGGDPERDQLAPEGRRR